MKWAAVGAAPVAELVPARRGLAEGRLLGAAHRASARQAEARPALLELAARAVDQVAEALLVQAVLAVEGALDQVAVLLAMAASQLS